MRRGSRPQGSLGPLIYSDGQKSKLTPPLAGGLLGWVLDIDSNGVLSDDERDADADGLGNWDEVRGRMTEAWWPAQHDGQNEPKESKYPELDFLDNEDTAPYFDAHSDPDIDGDGIVDGVDDNDHDGVSNQFEVNRPDDWVADAISRLPARFQPVGVHEPVQPLQPFASERCHSHPPINYYQSDEVPPVEPSPPAGTPDIHPPDGGLTDPPIRQSARTH